MASVTARERGWDVASGVEVIRSDTRPSLLVSVGLSLALLVVLAGLAVGNYCAKRNRREDWIDG